MEASVTEHILSPDVMAILQRYHFDRIPFETLRSRIASNPDLEAMHMIRGAVAPPPLDAVATMPARTSPEGEALAAEGRAAIARGELATVVLAGGMATRFGATVKALAPLLEGRPTRFLDAKLADVSRAARDAGATRIATTLMTSFATHDAITAQVTGRDVVCAPQFVSMRLTAAGELFVGNDGRVSLHASGHGDLPEALSLAGVVADLRAAGVRTLLVSNVDNIGATVDPAVFARHLRLGQAITVELVSKRPGDKGGLPVLHDGRLVLAEAFRLPKDFPHDRFPLFNTNTLWINLDALAGEHPWTWCVARKQVDGREAIQLERLVGELTWWNPTAYLHVSREDVESRFIPVKDVDELRRSAAQIDAVLRTRIDSEKT
jgi:UTP--glucose-1-phosphate uridylyltransferase